jgi:hypothetical protein
MPFSTYLSASYACYARQQKRNLFNNVRSYGKQGKKGIEKGSDHVPGQQDLTFVPFPRRSRWRVRIALHC